MAKGVQATYTGASGQMAVMGELLARRCNVAVPVVDTGEDVFVFLDGRPDLDRVQVKTGTKINPFAQGDGYSGDVSVPRPQLVSPDDPPLYYVFAFRLDHRWSDFVVIPRGELNALREAHEIGYHNHERDEIQLHFSFRPDSLGCSKVDFQPFRNTWSDLAVVRAAAIQSPPAQG